MPTDNEWLRLIYVQLSQSGSGGGGTSLTEIQVRNAVESASNLDQLESLLTAISNQASITEAQVRNAIEAAANLDQLESLLTAIAAQTSITEAQVRNAVESAANLDQLESLVTAISNQLNSIGANTPLLSNGGNPALFNLPGQAVAFALSGRSRVSIGVRVTNINTSVDIRMRCSLIQGGAYYPLSADGNAALTLTANGNYLYTWEGSAYEIDVAFDSEVGGTDAQVQIMIRAQ